MPIGIQGPIHKLTGNDPVTDKLTNGVFTVKATPFGQFFLVKQGEKFELPEKLYGKFTDIQYWLNYARSTKNNTGILLSGYKGTGKTIEAKKFCNDYNRPVIIIDKNFGEHNTELASFLAAPEFEDCVIFIDEFEKLFPNQSSEFLLGLLDGTYETKLTFLFTVNKDQISEYLVNRLGRIRYVKRYESLEKDVIEEVIEDMLKHKKHSASIWTLFHIIGVCTFDLLVNVIKEINLFGEDALTCAKRLNIKSEAPIFSVKLFIGDRVSPIKFHQQTLNLADFYNAPTKEQVEAGNPAEGLELSCTKSFELKSKEQAYNRLRYHLENFLSENSDGKQSQVPEPGESHMPYKAPWRRAERRTTLSLKSFPSSTGNGGHWTTFRAEDNSPNPTTQEHIQNFTPTKMSFKDFKSATKNWFTEELASTTAYAEELRHIINSDTQLKQLHYLFETGVDSANWALSLTFEDGENNLPASFYNDLHDTYLYLEFTLEHVQTAEEQATRLVYPTNPQIVFEFKAITKKKPIF